MKKSRSPALEAINVDMLFRQAPVGMAVSFVCAFVYVATMWRVLPTNLLIVWFVLGSAILLLRTILILLYRRSSVTAVNYRYWSTQFTKLAALSGLSWGLLPYFFFPDLSPFHQMFAIVVMTGIVAGGITTMSSVYACYRGFLLAVMLPLIVYLISRGDSIYWALSFLATIFTTAMLFLSQRIYATIAEVQKSRQGEGYRNKVMEMLAKGAPLPRIMESIVLGVEAGDSTIICSILLLDSAGKHLLYGAAPSLPDFYYSAIHGVKIGPGAGACGAAAYTGLRVIADDVHSQPFAGDYRGLAFKAGLRSCWSEPIKSSSGKVLGVFAIYQHAHRAPDTEDIVRIESAAHLAGLAIERMNLEEEMKQAAMVYQNSSEAMVVTDTDNRVITINAAFSQITGYSSDEMLGNEMIFSSRNASDVEVCRQMMDAVQATGKWQGELWNYRKNGERMACRVAVNSIYNPDQSAYRRVILLSDITEQKRADELIWKQANYDPLIGLPNRRLFRDRLEQEIRKAKRSGLPLGLLYLDLDRFKEVNDNLGHDAGDKLLIEVASRIASCVRGSDTIARLGGDEFTVILPEMEDIKIVERAAQSIIEKISEAFYLGDDAVHVSVSIGITIYPVDATEIDGLLKNADLAMYAAKKAGRNRFSYFTGVMQKGSVQRPQIH